MLYYRNIIYSTPFLPYFFYNYDIALLEIKPCMAMFPTDSNLSNSAINKIFVEKASPYTNNAKTFYTDGSKLDKDAPSGANVPRTSI